MSTEYVGYQNPSIPSDVLLNKYEKKLKHGIISDLFAVVSVGLVLLSPIFV